ncbi:hypothetical protein D3C71_24450 [compost metagenome]
MSLTQSDYLLDPELQYIAQESARLYVQDCKERGVEPSVGSVAASYCHRVAEAVADRAAEKLPGRPVGRLTAREAYVIGSDTLVRQDKDQKLSFLERIDLAAQAVVTAAAERAVKGPPPEERYEYVYINFNEGFCNPLKH